MKIVRGVTYFCLISLILFVMCCFWSVYSAETKDGALSVVDIDNNEEAVVENDDDDEPLIDEVFYPTKEWQTIKPGQAIPKGLHVRVNLETGLKEAKLMEEDTDGLKYWKEGDKEGMVNTDNKHFSVDEIKKALKEFKANQDDVQDEKLREEAVKKQFRSYKELKEDLKAMKTDIKTDFEIIKELMLNWRIPDLQSDQRVELLEEIEYHVHQIDNGVLFADLGGIAEMVKYLNHTDYQVRSHAALVLGSASQSNPKVQVAALDAGALQQLIHMIAIEPTLSTQSRVLYAVSSLVRNFPHAQQKLLELGGVDTLMRLFNRPDAEKLKIKTVSLMNTLLNEQDLMEKHHDPNDTVQVEKLKQYSRVPLRESLLENGWCSLLPSLLSIDKHDSREKVLNAMTIILSECKSEFEQSLPSLRSIQTKYHELSLMEDDLDDNYFGLLSNTAKDLIQKISHTKDEL